MEKKFYLTLDKDFVEYCKINNINDIEKRAKEVFNVGFNITKYGNNPYSNTPYIPIADTLTKKEIKNKKDSLYD